MKLASDWRDILRRAWSVRLMILAALLSGVEIVLPLFVDSFSRGTFAVLSFVSVGAALIARVIAQRDL